MSQGWTEHIQLLAAKGLSLDFAHLFPLAIGVGVIAMVVISTRNRIRRSQTSSEPSALERYTDLRDQRGAARDLETVMKELDDLSRQIHGRLDTKLVRLEALIGDADRRIEKLARLERAAVGEPTIDVTLEPEMPGASPAQSAPNSESNRHEAAYRLADSGLNAVEIARRLDRNIGEIELILSLRRARGQPGYAGDLSRVPQSTMI